MASDDLTPADLERLLRPAFECALAQARPGGKTPSGFPQLNPYLVAANRAMQQIVTLSSELGLSPSSRTRIQTMGSEDGDDAFERFRQERRRPTSS